MSNLNRRQRSLCAKHKCGVLPLAIETGRFKNVPEELRLCCVSNKCCIENEYHHLLECEGLEHLRKAFEKEYLDDSNEEYEQNKGIVKCMIQKDRVNTTGMCLQALTEVRNEVIYELYRMIYYMCNVNLYWTLLWGGHRQAPTYSNSYTLVRTKTRSNMLIYTFIVVHQTYSYTCYNWPLVE